ncbi:hypothetical protein BGZ68_005757 [Mortierella alpina]|nr:hypothetical protein BGZ68_005757 [Mortierella alpina]
MGPMLMYPLVKTVDTVELTLTHVGGQTIVSWDDIERAFPGMKRVQDGRSAIKFVGGSSQQSCSVDVVLTNSCAPTGINRPRVDRVDRHARRMNAPPEDSVLDPWEAAQSTTSTAAFRYAVAQTSRGPYENHIMQFYASLWAPKVQASSDLYETFDKTIMVSHEEFTRADDRQETGRPLVELTNTMSSSTAPQAAMSAMHETTKCPQKQTLINQEDMKEMAVFLSCAQAILTQTYKLHEYPVPRLFVVLPQDPEEWDPVNVFANKFRLYFLCECGEHTKSINKNTKIPHHIHLAKHEGYEIARPSEFFQQYGSYVLTILKMIKYEVTVAGVAMPAFSQLISPDVLGQTIQGLKALHTILPRVDQVISWLDNAENIEGDTCHVDNKEAMQGADLRKLGEFLQGNNGDKVLGNLYKIVTDKEHVKWVCIDHIRELYSQTAVNALRHAVGSVGGSFDENNGMAKVNLKSRGLAKHFYSALREARFVHELDICLEMNYTRNDLEALEHALKKSTVSILRLDLQHLRPCFGNLLSSVHARNDVLLRIMEHPHMKVVHIVFSRDFIKHSYFLSKTPPHLHKLSFEMVSKELGATDFRTLSEILKTNSKLTVLDLGRSSLGENGAQALAEVLKANSTLVTLSLEENSLEDRGAQALAEALTTNSTLVSLNLGQNSIGDDGAQALSEALRSNSSLAVLNLEINSIGFDGAQALAEALKINATLTTLNLYHSSIGPNGAQALADTIKTNTTLISLNLSDNSIGDSGALALAEALRINTSLSSLDVSFNLIEDEAGRAVLEVLSTNSTLVTLNVSWNRIKHKGAQVLAEALKTNSTLASLDLEYNKIGCYGALVLADALKMNSTLTTLDLGDSEMEPTGAQALADMIKTNVTLTTLNLGMNSIGHSGALALAEALRTNATLTTLYLISNAIGFSGAQALAEALKTNSTLLTLDVMINSIGPSGAQVLAEALKVNSSLTSLYLDDNSIGEIGAMALAGALKINSTLTFLSVRWNMIGYNAAKALHLMHDIDRNLTIRL